MATNNAINNIDKLTMNIVSYNSGSGTYTPTANTKYIIVEMCGGGGGVGTLIVREYIYR